MSERQTKAGNQENFKKKMHMGQILQDGKKVLEMSVTYLHSKSRPAQTVGLGTFSF